MFLYIPTYNVDEMTHGFLKILVDKIRTFIILLNNVIKAKLIQVEPHQNTVLPKKKLPSSLWNRGLLNLLRSLHKIVLLF